MRYCAKIKNEFLNDNRLSENYKEEPMPSNAAEAKNSISVQQPALSNAQMELIKLYSTNLDDRELLELKNILVQHFSRKAINEADSLWEEKGMSAQTMNDWLNEN
jgi:hypothetical protein